jgi:hypothetical protein
MIELSSSGGDDCGGETTIHQGYDGVGGTTVFDNKVINDTLVANCWRLRGRGSRPKEPQ